MGREISISSPGEVIVVMVEQSTICAEGALQVVHST